MDDLDSLRLALDAERHNHRKDNEYLIAERDRAIEQRENANAATLRAETERDRLRRALEEIAEVGGPPYPDWTAAGRAEDREAAMQRVAREALAPNQTDQTGGGS